eukprot:scaffold6249_cov124-Isochrysis_galbana.AAC.12
MSYFAFLCRASVSATCFTIIGNVCKPLPRPRPLLPSLSRMCRWRVQAPQNPQPPRWLFLPPTHHPDREASANGLRVALPSPPEYKPRPKIRPACAPRRSGCAPRRS